MSLDGFIAGIHGEHDWIVVDPEIDFAEIFAQFDTLLVGRRTFEAMVAAGRASVPGVKMFVFSRTLQQEDFPDVHIVADKPGELVTALKKDAGKDIWLFGGGSLFRNLAELALVDTVEVAVEPVLLGQGIPLLPGSANRISLSLTGHRVYRSGIVSLEYRVERN
jgi:dihydrofolate reductase